MDPHSNVFHNTAQLRFELTNSAGTAILEYHLGGLIMTIHHTFVPVELRGQHIAGCLAKAAFQLARTEGLSIIPQCTYIARYAERSPEEAALLHQHK